MVSAIYFDNYCRSAGSKCIGFIGCQNRVEFKTGKLYTLSGEFCLCDCILHKSQCADTELCLSFKQNNVSSFIGQGQTLPSKSRYLLL